MSNTIPPPPESPLSITAAELRRRLLASTPPPMGVGLGSPEINLEQELPIPAAAQAAAPTNWATPPISEGLSRLRMPGQTGPVSVPQPNAGEASAAPRYRRPAGYGGYGAPPGSGPQAAPGTRTVSNDQRLVAENAELRQLLGEMKHLLQEASNTEQKFEVKLKEQEAQLAERNHQVEEMTSQLHQIEEQIANGTLAPQQPQRSKTELEEWNDELEQESSRMTNERKQLDKDMKQLRDDEEALEKQMRTMEVSMAKERAMLARQETELRRLNAEIQHELEIMNRGDAALREQMQKFQRRAQDVMQKSGGNPPAGTVANNQSGPQGWGRR